MFIRYPFLRYCAIKGTVFSGVFVLSPRSVRCAFTCTIHLDDCLTDSIISIYMNCAKEEPYEWAEPGSHVISKSELIV